MKIIQYLPGTGGRSPFLIGLSQTIFLRRGTKTIAPYYYSLSGKGKKKLCLSQGKFPRYERLMEII
ncbi:hypothetical protein [Okeania sp. KiyG1]|uniref:hypothetical protein n=1 Tax=Okeania sp. KiyG1 TaxID=2720165 RepID=UPI001921F573|nr:hypothetical protein [Okeania sp. KiyG1]